jgi:hypothetical protein
MSKAAVAALEEAIKKEMDALGRDRHKVEELKRDITAHEASVKTRTANVGQLKSALETIRIMS